MNNMYVKKFSSICPSDGESIQYHFSLWTDKKVMVEEINKTIEQFEQMYHEDIADALFSVFKGHQQLEAVHQGVYILTTRDDK